jgi:hypothetical protein
MYWEVSDGEDHGAEFKREVVQAARRPRSSVAQVAKARQDDLTDDYVGLREMAFYASAVGQQRPSSGVAQLD